MRYEDDDSRNLLSTSLARRTGGQENAELALVDENNYGSHANDVLHGITNEFRVQKDQILRLETQVASLQSAARENKSQAMEDQKRIEVLMSQVSKLRVSEFLLDLVSYAQQ